IGDGGARRAQLTLGLCPVLGFVPGPAAPLKPDLVGASGDLLVRGRRQPEPGRLVHLCLSWRGMYCGSALHSRPVATHERNNLVYWASWAMEERSTMIAADPRSSSVASSASALVTSTARSSSAIASCPSVWPSGTRRTPAFT